MHEHKEMLKLDSLNKNRNTENLTWGGCYQTVVCTHVFSIHVKKLYQDYKKYKTILIREGNGDGEKQTDA